MTAPPPPTPLHLIRSHNSPVGVLAFSDDNERIYSGDASGRVVVTSTRSLRAITAWNAHTDGLLGVEEWYSYIITHGRDNKLHVWTRIDELPTSARVGGSAAVPDLPTPTLCYSMDVNALNYCRFSLLRLTCDSSGEDAKALIGLPNLIDSSVADIWSLPSCERIHASIGQQHKKSIFSTDPKGRNGSGIIMSLHVYRVPRESEALSSVSEKAYELRLLCAYENGEVVLRRYARDDKAISVEGAGWETMWTVKLHVESIMAMRVSRANDLALTVSADNIIGRYDLTKPDISPENGCNAFKTKHAGNGTIAIRDDGKVCAVGGWDGRIRLYSTRSLKPLGTLKYHKENCQVVEFARFTVADEVGDEEDEDMSEQEKAERARWLVGGGKDNRVTIWPLISFTKI